MGKKSILIHGIPDNKFYDSLSQKKDIGKVYVTELRPGLFGANIVCKDLLKLKIIPILICDNMVGFCLDKKMLDEIHLFAKSKSKESVKCFVGSLIYAICAVGNKVKVFAHNAGQVKKEPKSKDLVTFCGESIAAKGVDTYVTLWEDVPVNLINRIEG